MAWKECDSGGSARTHVHGHLGGHPAGLGAGAIAVLEPPHKLQKSRRFVLKFPIVTHDARECLLDLFEVNLGDVSAHCCPRNHPTEQAGCHASQSAPNVCKIMLTALYPGPTFDSAS